MAGPDQDDPNNVKPTPLKLPDAGKGKEAPQNEKENVKSKSRMKVVDRNNRAPSFTPVGFKAHPLLKLNEFMKNCSQADSDDSNCEFVKKVDYNSEAVSSASCVESKKPNEHDQKAKPVKTSHMNRAEMPVVKASGSKSSINSRDRAKDSDKKKDDSKEKGDSKERKESKEHSGSGGSKESKDKGSKLAKKEKESVSKGSSGSKDKDKKHGNKDHKSNKDKSKDKDKDKEKEKEKDKKKKKK